MNLGELVAYRERVQALERELAELAGRVRASSNASPHSPPQRADRSSSSSTAPNSSDDSGQGWPGQGWQNPAPADAPRLPPRSASSRAAEVERIDGELCALERSFKGCARNVHAVRQAFTAGLQAAGLRHRPG